MLRSPLFHESDERGQARRPLPPRVVQERARELWRPIVAGTPLGRLGQPEDIAKVAVFLASDNARWLTGERIAASGGFR
jgi:NAD(P)-dependent dehydrogenase (short-subunit alcohol dehydrogenase family)